MARITMLGGLQRHKGLLYKRDTDNKLTDIPLTFYYEFVDGENATTAQILQGRISKASGLIIQSDSQVDFQPQELVILNGFKYLVMEVEKIPQSAYNDLKYTFKLKVDLQ